MLRRFVMSAPFYTSSAFPALPDPDGDAGAGAGGGSAAGAGGQGGAPQAGEHGFPAETPTADMTTEQQVAYWKFHARKHEQTANARKDYDEIKTKYDTLTRAAQTDQERAVTEASEKARAEARAELAPMLAAAEFRAAAVGRMTTEQIDGLIEDLDLAKYVKDGQVDRERIAKKLDVIAPKDGGTGTVRQRTPDTGGGNRGGTKISAAEQGRLEAERRYGKQTTAVK